MTNTQDQNIPKRLQFPLNEAVHHWLTPLMDSYFIADKGIYKAVFKELKKGRALACTKGCSSCCKTHKDIPVFPLELVGITWFATEKVEGETRQILKRQLLQHQTLDGCPFLVEDVCSIHPMRPLACRHFNVFGQVCADGEDAYHTRRQDVLTPIKKYKDEALQITLPFYASMDTKEQKKLIESGSLNKLARAMKDCHWQSLPAKMDSFEERS